MTLSWPGEDHLNSRSHEAPFRRPRRDENKALQGAPLPL